MGNLTAHFTLEELVASDTARRRGIDNTPSATVAANLRRTAEALERVRELLGGRPVVVTSGYRSPALNSAIGGVPNSAHKLGLAADFVCPKFGTPLDICRAISRSSIEFDQLIQEGTWVHIGLAAAGVKPRRQVLTASFGSARTMYSEGL
ncbi:D-Ala-D-Ala carboxypeptidase family metallohydrolase [Burkholderia territorii]|uniref:D-Ala-D-Ala carboxypeptidase family metallohydrolase n=1 Tax=Burkholderia territorii TaxID=1503055 RepID=UPI000752342B|nr:D-Ala-D-Ala carboxypeptidase family metallohydrolase [Burkholderia territorii]KUZ33599.1 peptidase M15 [Burkholderia territorii]KUZ43564.1 peptidase M15 [Burkholderia territorii]